MKKRIDMKYVLLNVDTDNYLKLKKIAKNSNISIMTILNDTIASIVENNLYEVKYRRFLKNKGLDLNVLEQYEKYLKNNN